MESTLIFSQKDWSFVKRCYLVNVVEREIRLFCLFQFKDFRDDMHVMAKSQKRRKIVNLNGNRLFYFEV